MKSAMSRVADKNGMIARRATPVVVIVAPTIRCGEAVWCESGGSGLSRTKGLRPTVSRPLCQGAQHRERPFLLQPARELALRAVCYVRLLANGTAIRVVAFLASHPAKPNSRPCGTSSEAP